MSVLFTDRPDEARCYGPITPDPMRRSDRCPYRADYIALPLEQPCCPDHIWDFQRSRAVTAFDIERAHCAACKDVQQGAREVRREERRGRRAEGAPRPPPRRGRDERWCEAHDAAAFAQWIAERATKGRRG